jgi:hypothetical protein
MNFEQAYRTLITAENLPVIKKMLTRDNDYSKAIIAALEIRQHNGLNYLYAQCLDALHGRAAILDSTFIYCKDLVPEWKGLFYISVLQAVDLKKYPFEKYLPYDTVIQHELLHLRQLIARFCKDEQQILRAAHYCFAVSDSKNLEESMRYEFEKIFLFETEAHAQDWELGVHHSFSMDENRDMKAIRYDVKNTYLKNTIAYYIVEMTGMFSGKFPKESDRIRVISERLIQELGVNLFGQKPNLGMMGSLMDYMARSNNPFFTEKLAGKASKKAIPKYISVK